MARLDTSEVNPNDVDSKPPVPGKAQLLVTYAKEDEAKGSVTVGLSVLAHEKPEQEGRTFPLYLKTGGRSVGRTIKVALATGALTLDEWIDHKTNGAPLDPKWRDAPGNTFFTVLRMNKDKTGQYPDRIDIGWDLFRPGSPDAEGFPADKAYLPKEAAVGAAAGDEEVPF